MAGARGGVNEGVIMRGTGQCLRHRIRQLSCQLLIDVNLAGA